MVMEKDIALKLSKEVAAALRAQGIQTTLTRETDIDVPLDARTALANRVKADLFLSIHLNSNPKGPTLDLGGIEAYILNNSTDQSSKRLADLENMVLNGSQAGKGQAGEVSLILKDLVIDRNLPRSKLAACLIQDHAWKSSQGGVMRAKNRGIKQALFYVLLGADMPSVLLEAGFLSDQKDRNWMLSLTGQKRFGLAVARALGEYRRTLGTPKAKTLLGTCQVR